MMGELVEFDSWLVLLAQTGSRDALNQLFRSIQDPLFRYLNSLVKDPQHAEDILQEVFVRIYRKLYRKRSDRKDLGLCDHEIAPVAALRVLS